VQAVVTASPFLLLRVIFLCFWLQVKRRGFGLGTWPLRLQCLNLALIPDVVTMNSLKLP
jgi:hypothetical protein